MTSFFSGEMYRVMGPMVPECSHLKIFGDEKKNYDEAKRFCYFPDAKHAGGGRCVAYRYFEHVLLCLYDKEICASIGSNNNWAFEEYIHKDSECSIETFDCTINATIPEPIRDRTKFYHICLGTTNNIDRKNQKFGTLSHLNALVGRSEGPDYFKMDIEVITQIHICTWATLDNVR